MKLKAALISRFKIMAQLNIAERRVPQDGRIKLKMGKKVIDYRVSTLPTLFGEKIVLRILDKGNLTLDLEKFGIEPKAEKDLMEAVQNPYGMVLVTGPTGSGKTTTLYSALSKVNNIDVNIMTAEDPVEYNLYGVNQVLVRTDIGMTFAAALKAFLRQDPNIIMVGEIRDLETGGIAIKAALTGHMVLSHPAHQLGAGDGHPSHGHGARAVQRGVGAQPRAGAATAAPHLPQLQGAVHAERAEELDAAKVKPDDDAARPHVHPRDDREREGEGHEGSRAAAQEHHARHDRLGELALLQRPRLRRVRAARGMKGRQGVYEVMPMSPNLRKLILQNVGAAEIRDAAVDEGMLTLRMDGWMKVMKGITTLEQVIRETTA